MLPMKNSARREHIYYRINALIYRLKMIAFSLELPTIAYEYLTNKL